MRPVLLSLALSASQKLSSDGGRPKREPKLRRRLRSDRAGLRLLPARRPIRSAPPRLNDDLSIYLGDANLAAPFSPDPGNGFQMLIVPKVWTAHPITEIKPSMLDAWPTQRGSSTCGRRSVASRRIMTGTLRRSRRLRPSPEPTVSNSPRHPRPAGPHPKRHPREVRPNIGHILRNR